MRLDPALVEQALLQDEPLDVREQDSDDGWEAVPIKNKAKGRQQSKEVSPEGSPKELPNEPLHETQGAPIGEAREEFRGERRGRGRDRDRRRGGRFGPGGPGGLTSGLGNEMDPSRAEMNGLECAHSWPQDGRAARGGGGRGRRGAGNGGRGRKPFGAPGAPRADAGASFPGAGAGDGASAALAAATAAAAAALRTGGPAPSAPKGNTRVLEVRRPAAAPKERTATYVGSGGSSGNVENQSPPRNGERYPSRRGGGGGPRGRGGDRGQGRGRGRGPSRDGFQKPVFAPESVQGFHVRLAEQPVEA